MRAPLRHKYPGNTVLSKTRIPFVGRGITFVLGVWVGSMLVLATPWFNAKALVSFGSDAIFLSADDREKPRNASVPRKRDGALVNLAQASLEAFLITPESAIFESGRVVRARNGEHVCGSVYAKNRTGAYVGPVRFVWTSGDEAARLWTGENNVAASKTREHIIGLCGPAEAQAERPAAPGRKGPELLKTDVKG